MSILFDELAGLRDKIEAKIVECQQFYRQNRELLKEFNVPPGTVSIGECGFTKEIYSDPRALSKVLMSKYRERIKLQTYVETRETEFSSAYDSDTYYHDHNMLDVTVLPQ